MQLFLYTDDMDAVKHNITHHYQTKPTNCSQTALSILLSHYEMEMTSDVLEQKVPQCYNGDGQSIGSINQQLATWCIGQGFDVSLYTFDCSNIYCTD